jgi:hypothetical protein
MRRREFIAGLGGTVVRPRVARAQKSAGISPRSWASARRLQFHVSHGGEGRMMMFDDSWYGMGRHPGERGEFIPGEGFRAAPLLPRVSPAPAQPLRHRC